MIDNETQQTPSKAEIDAMREIVKELARSHDTYFDSWLDEHVCVFCNNVSRNSDTFKHDNTCIITKARVLIGNPWA